MQFLMTVRIGQHRGAPPTELQTAMTRFVDDETHAGRFVITGGLAPQTDGGGIRVSKHRLVRSKAHLPINGYSVVECPALEQAMEVATRLLQLHQDLVPEWEVECEVRPI